MRNVSGFSRSAFASHFAFRIPHSAFLLVLCVLCALCGSILPSCGKSEDPARILYVVSPHASDIRMEFTRAFAAWHKQKYGYEVTLKWPDHGGTSDIVRYLSQEYKNRPSCGYDVVFGGGSGVFDDLAARECGDGSIGYIVPPPNIQSLQRDFPQNTPAVTLRGEKNVWLAATASNFGIAVNMVRVAELKLTSPKSWEDLARPEWLGHVSLADPSKSGSVRTAYEMMLQQYGWQKGWKVVTLMFANADAIKDGGSNPAEETDLGNTAAGVVIDFFARNHVAKLGTDVMEFIVPVGGSAVDGDPIAMLRGAPHPELVGHLMEFVTSEDGQKIWTFRPNTPGGPAHKLLNRLAVRESMYKDPAITQYMFDPVNPFASTEGMTVDRKAQAQRSRFLGDLMKATFVDQHALLAETRKAINALRSRDPARADALEDRLGALPLYKGKPFTQTRYGEFLAEWSPPMPRKTGSKAQVDAAEVREKARREKMQTEIRDRWLAEASQRYHEILAEAKK